MIYTRVIACLWAICLFIGPVQAEKSPPVRPALTTTAVAAVVEQWPVTVSTSGAIAPWQEAVIGAEIGGLRIAEILVDVGAVVHRGQLLAQLAPKSVEIDLAQQRAVVAQAQAALAEARANADRARHVTSSGALSQQQIDQYLMAEQGALANLALAEARLDGQRLRLQQTRVTAVDDGVVTTRSASLGAVVAIGTELFRLIRGGRLEWRAEIIASQLDSIQEGQPARVYLPNGGVIDGTVRVKSPTLEVTNRRALVYVDLTPQPDGPVKAGLFAYGIITVGSAPALVLPQSAVVMRDGHDFVFAIHNGEQVSKRPVKLGRRMGDRVEVVTGIDTETAVAASGAAFLNDGDHIRLVSGPEPQRP
ncbi:MAG: efflux RND transporter periplasmic adaptor subunit [Magnetococcales bacterium]|nr:efflux RND transporter periplasmic adaptor subunit [Magnetococcales bacterium]